MLPNRPLSLSQIRGGKSLNRSYTALSRAKNIPSRNDIASASRPRPITRNLNIAVAFDLELHQATEIFQGITDYSRYQPSWNMIPLSFRFEELLDELVASNEIDGVIGSFVSDTWLERLGNKTLPTVNISKLSRIESVTTVGVDDRQVGESAAEALTASGHDRYAFIGIGGSHFSRLRYEGFSDRLFKEGKACEASYSGQSAGLTEWLRILPTPIGIFCVNDYLARITVLRCRSLAKQVPEEMAIMGVGNNPLDSILSGIPLTSIALPSREIGYKAAEELNCIIQEKPYGVRLIDLPPGELYLRESTLLEGRLDMALEKALNFIRQNLAQPIGIDDVARESGVSRRNLEMRFKRNLGRSPYRELTRFRMEEAQRLLTESDLRVYEIGERCGYPEQHQFSTAFKNWCGRSPRAYRQRGQSEK